MEKDLYDTFSHLAKGEKPKNKKKDMPSSSPEEFLYANHVLILAPIGFPEMLQNLFTDREKARMDEQSLVREVMEIVNLFYVMLPIERILAICETVREKIRHPYAGPLDEETLIRYINKLI